MFAELTLLASVFMGRLRAVGGTSARQRSRLCSGSVRDRNGSHAVRVELEQRHSARRIRDMSSLMAARLEPHSAFFQWPASMSIEHGAMHHSLR